MAVEVGEVCVDFEDPVGLGEDDGPDVEEGDGAREEGFDFHPCDDVVERPGGVEEDGADGEPPGIDGGVKEEPEALPDSEYQLKKNKLM